VQVSGSKNRRISLLGRRGDNRQQGECEGLRREELGEANVESARAKKSQANGASRKSDRRVAGLER
jgi:hypothetical protein